MKSEMQLIPGKEFFEDIIRHYMIYPFDKNEFDIHIITWERTTFFEDIDFLSNVGGYLVKREFYYNGGYAPYPTLYGNNRDFISDGLMKHYLKTMLNECEIFTSELKMKTEMTLLPNDEVFKELMMNRGYHQNEIGGWHEVDYVENYKGYDVFYQCNGKGDSFFGPFIYHGFSHFTEKQVWKHINEKYNAV